jgi:hypothetical protein
MIDGGAKGMVYNTGLSIQKDGTSQSPISIMASNEAGHSGQVVISGEKAQMANGIDLGNHSYINIGGQKWSCMRVAFFTGDGVSVGGGSQNVKLVNIEIDNNGIKGGGAGISLAGNANIASQMIVHDNATNVSISPSTSTGSSASSNELVYSWVYNYQDNTANKSNGVDVVDGQIGAANGSVMILDSVIGPGLSTGINVLAMQSAQTYIADCLILNAEKANLSRVAGSVNSLDVMRMTSFMTRHNAVGQAHAAIQFTEGSQDLIHNSIIVGGLIQVDGSRLLGPNNLQYGTYGGSMLVSFGEENPQFQFDFSKLPSRVPVNYLTNMNFARSNNARTAPNGLGSQVTSVKQLLSIAASN